MMSAAKETNVTLINDWLRSIGKKYGISLQLNSQNLGSITLEGQNDVLIRLNESCDSIRLVAYVSREIGANDSGLLQRVLEANLESDFLNGCAIGMCRITARFTLSVNIPVAVLNETMLDNFIMNFGVTLNTTTDRIKKLSSATSSSSSKSSQEKSDRLEPMMNLYSMHHGMNQFVIP